MRSKKRGFTLIELLVVIAIIAILAAILFPVFLSAREKGKEGRCLAHCRQLACAIAQYADDNDGWIVKSANPPPLTPVFTPWPKLLSPYFTRARVSICARAAHVRPTTAATTMPGDSE